MSDLVYLSYVEEYDPQVIEQSVKDAFLSLGFNKIHSKMKVLLKVCAPGSFSPDLAKTTNPAVVCGVANYISSLGAEVIVAESPYNNYSEEELDNVYINTGMLEVANSSKCTLNHNLKTSILNLPNGVVTKNIPILDVVNDVDVIINIGKLKMDENLGFVGSTANLFGFLPGESKTLNLNRLSYLKDYYNYLIDLEEGLKNKLVLNIVDGIVALESGDVQHMMYCLAVGENTFKLDACLCSILGIEFDKTLLKQAEERGLFNKNKPFKTIGEDLEKFKNESFAISDFSEETKIHKNTVAQKYYFKTHQRRVKIEQKHCKGCSVCSKICPTGAIVMRYDKNNELYAKIDYKKCIYCFKCHTACPYRVVQVITPFKYKLLDKQINKYNDKESAN